MWTLTGPFDGEVAGELGFQSKWYDVVSNVQVILNRAQRPSFSRLAPHIHWEGRETLSLLLARRFLVFIANLSSENTQ
jgi:hypothetical protein